MEVAQLMLWSKTNLLKFFCAVNRTNKSTWETRRELHGKQGSGKISNCLEINVLSIYCTKCSKLHKKALQGYLVGYMEKVEGHRIPK